MAKKRNRGAVSLKTIWITWTDSFDDQLLSPAVWMGNEAERLKRALLPSASLRSHQSVVASAREPSSFMST